MSYNLSAVSDAALQYNGGHRTSVVQPWSNVIPSSVARMGAAIVRSIGQRPALWGFVFVWVIFDSFVTDIIRKVDRMSEIIGKVERILATLETPAVSEGPHNVGMSNADEEQKP